MQNRDTELTELRDLLMQIAARLDLLIGAETDAPVEPVSIRDRYEKRICLNCGNQIAESDDYIRGLGACCHGKLLRWFRDGIESEKEYLRLGKIAPKGYAKYLARLDAKRELSPATKRIADQAAAKAKRKKSD